MRLDWDRRARVDARYWVSATEEATQASYLDSAERDAAALIEGLPAPPSPEARVLDLGCGCGRLTAPLSARCPQIIGVDVSAEMIAQGRAIYGEGLDLRPCSGVDLAEFEAGAFDLVFSYSVFPHLPPEVAAAYFYEVGRVLRLGGLFRLQFWVGPAHRPAENDTLSIRVYTPQQLEDLAALGGLRVLGLEEIDYRDPILDLCPVWVNLERVDPLAPVAPLASRGAVGAPSDDERGLEYSLQMYLAMRQADRGEIHAAEATLSEAIQLAPDRLEAYVQWATHRIEAGDLMGALKLIRELNERNAAAPIGWIYRARLAEALDLDKEASRALARFHRLPQPPEDLAQEAASVAEALDSKPKTRRKLKRGKPSA
ncbi:class I SAM-dependent methyltransferase [Myxococcota bacterium]|nr:class I SAM-dependent methyltransferase [Myxococcota bacterium]MBU1430489.1 class I SAM-dependent methyltransferase [Myxococcota bacterium]MBU1899087.1 class I SAM-dependent methyltransferase [Myxococcota bacterium]